MRVSYGKYQFASKKGVPEDFLNNEGREWKDKFKGAQSGSAAFSKTWKEIAKNEKDKFALAQHQYIERNYFLHNAEMIKKATGFDITKHSIVLQDVLWSTTVQHGADTEIMLNVIKRLGVNSSDVDIIKAVYAERGRVNNKGILVHFSFPAESPARDSAKGVQ